MCRDPHDTIVSFGSRHMEERVPEDTAGNNAEYLPRFRRDSCSDTETAIRSHPFGRCSFGAPPIVRKRRDPSQHCYRALTGGYQEPRQARYDTFRIEPRPRDRGQSFILETPGYRRMPAAPDPISEADSAEAARRRRSFD